MKLAVLKVALKDDVYCVLHGQQKLILDPNYHASTTEVEGTESFSSTYLSRGEVKQTTGSHIDQHMITPAAIEVR
jgi:hypothetical protein